jgi:hypothetical protein
VSKPAAVVYIPVKRHVRQFLLKELGQDPFHVDQRTFLGKLVQMATDKQPYRLVRAEKPLEPETRFGLVLPKALKHHSISEEKRRQIGDALEKYFQEILVNFVKAQVAVTQNELAALKQFFKFYDLNPDHYDLEAGRKQYRDYKDKILRNNGQFSLMYQPLATAAGPVKINLKLATASATA